MASKELGARLRALATESQGRSKTAQLREVYEDVEFALRAGVPRAEVLAELNNDGLQMTMAAFTSALQRIRRARVDVNAAHSAPSRQEPPAAESAPQPVSQAQQPSGSPVTAPAAKVPSPVSVRVPAPLPDDWRTGTITPEQYRRMTPEQRLERTRARDKMFFPNPYDIAGRDVPKEKAEPPGSAADEAAISSG